MGTVPRPREAPVDVEALRHELRDSVPTGTKTQTTVSLHNLCDLRLVDLEDWPDFFEDMRIDIEKECRKHGETVKTYVDKEEPQGTAYVRFLAPSMASRCQRAMDK